MRWRLHPEISEHRESPARRTSAAPAMAILRRLVAPAQACMNRRSKSYGRIGQRLQRKSHIGGRLKRCSGSLLQAAMHDSLQSRGVLAVICEIGWRLLVQNRGHRLRRRRLAKRLLARHHFVENCAERENVGAVIGRSFRAPARETCSRRSPSRRPAQSLGKSGFQTGGSLFAGPTLAKPKSRILTRPSLVTNRLSGLRSRWTIPFSCAAANPCAICTA